MNAPEEAFDLGRVGRETELADRNKQSRFIFRVKSKFYSHITFSGKRRGSDFGMLFPGETLKLGENGLGTGHADDLCAHRAIHEIAQRGNRLDFVGGSQVGIVVNVDLENPCSSIARFRNLVQDWLDQAARLAPACQEADQYRKLGVQDLTLELRLIDFLNLLCFHRRISSSLLILNQAPCQTLNISLTCLR